MKTIEEFAKEYSIKKETPNEWDEMIMDLMVNDRMEDVKAGVEFAQRWIPIEEELPETKPNHYKRCISKDILFQTVKNVYLGYYDLELNEWYSDGELIKNVVKWRPIEYK